VLEDELQHPGVPVAFQVDGVDHRPRAAHARQRRSERRGVRGIQAQGQVGDFLRPVHEPAQHLGLAAREGAAVHVDVVRARGDLHPDFGRDRLGIELLQRCADRLARRVTRCTISMPAQYLPYFCRALAIAQTLSILQ
jgi:hypothetical protein